MRFLYSKDDLIHYQYLYNDNLGWQAFHPSKCDAMLSSPALKLFCCNCNEQCCVTILEHMYKNAIASLQMASA